MSIKSVILSLINTKLASASNITASEHREVEVALLDNLYPTVINETHATTNTITTKNTVNTNLQYNVNIYKQGRTVFINGFIKNNSGSAVNDFFLKIVGSEYLPAPIDYAGNFYICNTNETLSGLNLATLDENKIRGIVPANGTVVFSLNYPTLN